ncbi:pentatricopeptide repeat-containing protein At2g01510, mitochondrial [Malania oleifera]|uniref:pentatricopeptide repeat-containing protein At2g01510, mitochondrial n=1 Tax=Malania oleifera TaxID=397392 RepID=UPI0025AEC5D5|nr:pentatricopeptide repeat-containing protein At2g01510, mitochondrial [Malania oleifera]
MIGRNRYAKPYFILSLQELPSTLRFSSLLHTQEDAASSNPWMPLTKQGFAKLLQIQSHSSTPTTPSGLKRIHALLLTTGLSIKNSLITQLLSSLTVLGDMHYARQLFDEMHKPRPFLWNTLIKGYVKNELPVEAVSVYRKMRSVGVRPDEFTYPFVIKACAELVELWAGIAVHAHALKYGLEYVAMVKTELVVMYVKIGELGSADFLFLGMVDKDLVAWNAFIAVCVQTGYAAKSLALFRQMCTDGVKLDSVSVVSAISACGHLGCLEIGEEIYKSARKKGVDCNIIVKNALLDMYAKCGSIDLARHLFDEMPHRNVISWSTMIGGYAINGESEKALALFSRMQKEGLHPNYVTFLGVLSACSHAGLLSEGWVYFKYMAQSDDKNIQPRKEHYSCMVDLLARSGHLEEAYKFIRSLPFEPDPGVWGALLGACAIHQNIELGQHVADLLFGLAPDIAAYHILMSNMYAAAGRWHNVEKVRLKMRRKSVNKVAAYSSVEFNGQIHVLYGGDRSHPQSASIYKKLDDLVQQIKSIGYIPSTRSVFHDVEMEEKEAALGTHSEKIAIAFGLINFSPENPIRVMKNLRICDDCHTYSKFVSKITMRDIIMRDKNRFHHFKGGICSCKDFW